MKRILSTILLVLPFLLSAQTSGEITFKETIKLEIELPEGMEQFKDMVPTSQDFTKLFSFNEKATIYKDKPVDKEDKNNSVSAQEGGMQFQMDFARPDNQIYCDLETGKTVEKQDFMGKKFLINGEAKRHKWKMTGEQKTILDYACQKAIFKDTSRTTVAWFTTQIPIATGPASYAGLPGMILELDIDEGKHTIQATHVELKELEKGVIVAPKKGKKVTKEEFKKIVEEKTKEMKEQFGGSGNMIIEMRGN